MYVRKPRGWEGGVVGLGKKQSEKIRYTRRKMIEVGGNNRRVGN